MTFLLRRNKISYNSDFFPSALLDPSCHVKLLIDRDELTIKSSKNCAHLAHSQNIHIATLVVLGYGLRTKKSTFLDCSSKIKLNSNGVRKFDVPLQRTNGIRRIVRDGSLQITTLGSFRGWSRIRIRRRQRLGDNNVCNVQHRTRGKLYTRRRQ